MLNKVGKVSSQKVLSFLVLSSEKGCKQVESINFSFFWLSSVKWDVTKWTGKPGIEETRGCRCVEQTGKSQEGLGKARGFEKGRERDSNRNEQGRTNREKSRRVRQGEGFRKGMIWLML